MSFFFNIFTDMGILPKEKGTYNKKSRITSVHSQFGWLIGPNDELLAKISKCQVYGARRSIEVPE